MIYLIRKLVDNRVDNTWYINNYKDVMNSKMDPKQHYAKYGKFEERIPNPQYGVRSIMFKLVFFLFNYCHFRIFEVDSHRFKFLNYLQRRILKLFCKYEYNFIKYFKNDNNKLYITSWVGGGVSEVLPIYLDQDLKEFDSIMILRSIKNVLPSKNPIFEIEIHSKSNDAPLKFICPIPEFFLIELFNNQKLFKHIDVHHVFGFEKMIDELFINLSGKMCFYFHDYYLFSENWSFFEVPMMLNDTEFSYFDSELNILWPLESRLLLLNRVNEIVATSYHSYKFLMGERKILKDKLRFRYIPEKPNLELTPVNKPKELEGIFKIIILGNLGIYKGLNLLNSLIDLLKSDNLDIHFFHIGGVAEGKLSSQIVQYGWMEKNDRHKKILEINADLALVPAQSPETYSVILSDLFNFQIPILASNIGAIPERLLDREYSNLVDDYSNPKAWLDQILTFQSRKSFPLKSTSTFSEFEKNLIREKRTRRF